ncbi:MAG: hypothetical protein PHX21_03050 [bacterium]|nr:hypothetical protein [bacterium]
MKKKSITLIIGITIILLSFLTYIFILGKLFPYSPIIIGFTKYESPNTIIYIQKGNTSANYNWVDSLIPSVEKFHELKFNSKPKIFFFRDKKTYSHRSLSKARFCAFTNGNIVVSPWAQKEAEEGKISMEIYLKHELSHSIILQNKGILAGLKYPKWLLEGIATYSVNQMGTSFYPGKEETYTLIKQGNFMPPYYFHTKKEAQIKLNVKYIPPFMYSEFACIVDYLIETRGRDKFLVYMKSLLKEDNHNKVFKEVYGIDFDEFILNFKKFVENNNG